MEGTGPGKTQKIGQWGEVLAIRYLAENGYQILHQNWRSGRQEIDCIAQIGDTLVFVEVKTRKNNNYGYPEQFVDKQKIAFIKKAAREYLWQVNHKGNIRLDILAISGFGEKVDLHHLQDAF